MLEEIRHEMFTKILTCMNSIGRRIKVSVSTANYIEFVYFSNQFSASFPNFKKLAGFPKNTSVFESERAVVRFTIAEGLSTGQYQIGSMGVL